MPTVVAGAGRGGGRIGRCRGLPAEHALAFAMGTHGRLGGGGRGEAVVAVAGEGGVAGLPAEGGAGGDDCGAERGVAGGACREGGGGGAAAGGRGGSDAERASPPPSKPRGQPLGPSSALA